MRKSLLTLLFLLFTAIQFNIKAQPPEPGGGVGEKPNCSPPPCVPIDGGISLLLVAGVALGGKKLYNIQKS